MIDISMAGPYQVDENHVDDDWQTIGWSLDREAALRLAREVEARGRCAAVWFLNEKSLWVEVPNSAWLDSQVEVGE